MATLTVWTSRAAAPPRTGSGPPGPSPGPPRRPWEDLHVIVPVVHGLTTSATILVALPTVMTVG